MRGVAFGIQKMDVSSNLAKCPSIPAPLGRSAASTSTACLKSNWGVATRILHPDKSVQDPNLAVSPPIYQTATFQQLSATEVGKYIYTRSGNPTRDLLEEQMAALDGGVSGHAFAGGIAALTACFELLSAEDTVLAGVDVYGGTSRLLEHILPRNGINVIYNDFSDLEVVEENLKLGNVKMVLLESTTNPRMQVCDISTISKMAHDIGALVVVDNSVLAPTFCQPLQLGADICMTSSTKFISGHSDVSGGILTVKDKDLGDKLYFTQNAMGLHLGPFDCWLNLRGLKTMSLRMEQQANNCEKLVEYLSSNPLVKKINYPGLKDHPGYGVHASQATSGGSLLSFTTGNLEASKIIIEESKLFLRTVSFGSVTSSISLPCFMSHASMSAELREARGLPDDLVRISTGIESAEDLISDLDRSFEKANKAVMAQDGAKR